jgi:hypothetical protein
VLAATGIRAAFWLYTFRFIDVNSNPLGDVLEGMAIFPFGFYCAPAGKAMMLDLAVALAIALMALMLIKPRREARVPQAWL